MENNGKISWHKALGKLTGLVAFCLALALVLFPAQPGLVVSGEVNIDSARVQQQTTQPRAQAQSQTLIPLGRTTGIKMFSEGAMVVDYSDPLEQESPARLAGVEIGDVIIALNGNPVTCNEDLVRYLSELKSPEVTLTVRREGSTIDLNVKTVYDEPNGIYRLGAWVRDSIAGIGTITFVDPQNGAFGALGHGISDADTGRLMQFDDGSIMESTVIGVTKGAPGVPGELTGAFNLRENQGVLYSNNDRGIFGIITKPSVYDGRTAIPIADKSEIREGAATILSNVEGDTVEEFDIEIVRVYSGTSGTRDMMVRVTDENLLGITGGIVQGMSGSPIIQNGKLIGAVTHVLINDPTRGYGISIENMLAGSLT